MQHVPQEEHHMSLNIYVADCKNLTEADRDNYEYFVASSMMVLGINSITEENLAECAVKFAMLYIYRSEERYSVRNITRILSKYVGCKTNVTPMAKQKGRNHAFDIATKEVSRWASDWAAAKECSTYGCYSIVWDHDESKCDDCIDESKDRND
jgi:hypothetical protein